MLLCLFIHVLEGVMCMPQWLCGGQGQELGLSYFVGLERELQLWGLAASTFILWAIPLALFLIFFFKDASML